MPRRPTSTSASRASASASSQVIANIERVSMLFLTKTVYATLLAVLFGILVLEFPFLPRQLSITDGLTIGIPAFFLALMPNAQRYIPGFLRRSLVAVCLIEIVRLVQRRYVARTLVDASAHPTVPHPQAVSRPVPVTLAVVAVYLGGLASAMFGVLFLLSRYEVPADLVVIVSLVGAGIILFGLLSVAAAAGLSRGSGLSRLFVTLLAAALIVLQAWTLALAREWSWWAAAQIVVYLLVLIALWAPPPGAARRVRVAPGEGCTPGEGGAGARAARQSVQARPARRLVIRSISADWVARIDSATCSVRGSLPRSRRASAIGTAPSWWRIISRRNVQSAAVPDSARSWARSAALAIPIWVMSSASDAGADPPPCS